MTNDLPPKSRPGQFVPQRTSTIGMYLFLVALFMLFAAAMLGYFLIRVRATQKMPMGSLHMPGSLWISTVLVVTASFTIHRALAALRQERQGPFRSWLLYTLLLAIAFVVVQAPSMAILLARQREMRQYKLALYGLIFFLVLLHALHVLGGIVALARVSLSARRGIYDHEHFLPIRYVALYWHFLDGVWLIMFFSFLIGG